MNVILSYVRNEPDTRYSPIERLSEACFKNKTQQSLETNIFHKMIMQIQRMGLTFGGHSMISLRGAGFECRTNENTVYCKECGLEIPEFPSNQTPFGIHSTLKPDCPFVQKLKPSNSGKGALYSTFTPMPTTTTATTTNSITAPKSNNSSMSVTSPSSSAAIVRSASISNDHENPSKRQKIETDHKNLHSNILYETENIQQIRKRTFSHWVHRTTPTSAQMIEAGFFCCNVGDRVICIYCNLICQQWVPHTDDPCEIHKTFSPSCVYVKAYLTRREQGSILIVNGDGVETTSGSQLTMPNKLDRFHFNPIVHTSACNAAYMELPKRMASFSTWPNENLPPVEDLVRAGFFYTGTKSIVTCFYCNGSLQNWGSNDNPTIEHARWFPHCAYAKQLCGDELYRKIQESKKAQQERARVNDSKNKNGLNGTNNNNSGNSNSRLLFIPDESTLSRLVAARLDLPISQRLLNKNFKLSVIKRCWEDQLRLKQDDFVMDSDLLMACTILQKQIEHIDGKKENIVVPSIKMKKLREDAEKAKADALVREQITTTTTTSDRTEPIPADIPNSADVDMTTSTINESITSARTATTEVGEQIKGTKQIKSNTTKKNEDVEQSPANPCVLCLTEEKRLACIPCGHLATCVPCGHSLRSCPICRREINAFVRIYI